MKRSITVAFFFLTSFACITAAEAPAEVEWVGTIGQDKANPERLYSLLFLGFLRQDLPPTCEGSRKQWLQEHPHARLVPVAELRPFDQRNPKSELLFVWIIDHGENLSVDLVRRGCAPAAALFTLLPEAHLKVPQKQFEQVKDRLLAAEKLAKAEELGLWSKDNESSDSD